VYEIEQAARKFPGENNNPPGDEYHHGNCKTIKGKDETMGDSGVKPSKESLQSCYSPRVCFRIFNGNISWISGYILCLLKKLDLNIPD